MARVLVIDDDILVGKAIRTMLVALGHTVVVAEGGRSAMPALELYAFDVVMVDIIMPDVNGIDVIKAVREAAPDVSIIAMSGYAFHGGSSDRDFLALAKKFGAEYVMQKPFKPLDLVVAIDTCIGPEDDAKRAADTLGEPVRAVRA